MYLSDSCNDLLLQMFLILTCKCSNQYYKHISLYCKKVAYKDIYKSADNEVYIGQQ